MRRELRVTSLFGADPHIGVSVAPTGCNANGVASAGNPLDLQRADATFALAYDSMRDDTAKGAVAKRPRRRERRARHRQLPPA